MRSPRCMHMSAAAFLPAALVCTAFAPLCTSPFHHLSPPTLHRAAVHFPCDQSERGRDEKKNQQARKNTKLEKFKNVESGIGFCSPARRLVCHKPLDIRWQMKSNDYGKQKNAAMAAIPYLGSLFYARNNSILSLSLLPPLSLSLVLFPLPVAAFSSPPLFPFQLSPPDLHKWIGKGRVFSILPLPPPLSAAQPGPKGIKE